MPEREGHADLTAALRHLAAEGLTRIFCEGGADLAAALIRANLVDELAHFGAGALIGAEGRAALGGLDLGALSDAPRLTLIDVAPVGADTLTRWQFGT